MYSARKVVECARNRECALNLRECARNPVYSARKVVECARNRECALNHRKCARNPVYSARKVAECARNRKKCARNRECALNRGYSTLILISIFKKLLTERSVTNYTENRVSTEEFLSTKLFVTLKFG